MKKWKLSSYTSVFEQPSGDLLLHNGFMGAVARIPPSRANAFQQFFEAGVTEADLIETDVQGLCDGGFFAPAEMDEHAVVPRILDQERNLLSFRLSILPHQHCNFRCTYCYERFKLGRMQPEVVAGLKALANRLASEFPELQVNWFGGEPLLALSIVCELSAHFRDCCGRSGARYASGMTTNGYRLHPEVVTLLLNHGVTSYQVTLDGPERLHDAHRKLKGGAGTYRRILANLCDMRSRLEEFKVNIRVNFDRSSVDHIEHWVGDELAPLLGDDQRFALEFHPVGRWGGSNDRNLEVCDADRIEAARLGFLSRSQFARFPDRRVKALLSPHGNVCYAGKETAIVVGSDGKVYKCTLAFDDPRNLVGRLTPNGELELDRSRWELWTKTNGNTESRCGQCSFFPCCQGRVCPLATMNRGLPVCPMSRKEYERLVQLVADHGRVHSAPRAQ